MFDEVRKACGKSIVDLSHAKVKKEKSQKEVVN